MAQLPPGSTVTWALYCRISAAPCYENAPRSRGAAIPEQQEEMTTVVVVRKAGQIAIAADTLVTFGDTRLANRFEDNTKIFKVETDTGPSFLGMAGTVAHFPVLRKAIGSMPREILKLGSKDDVFDTFTKLHPYLKDNFFLQTKEEDS